MSFHIEAFAIDGVKIALDDDNYTETYGFVDHNRQTEAGTTRRDVVRIGYLAELSIKINTTGAVKKKFDEAADDDSLTLTLWNTKTDSTRTWTCYIDDYKAQAIRDTATETYWSISCTFKDLMGY